MSLYFFNKFRLKPVLRFLLCT